jgi:cytoskeletal protein CcmA (bactofilin family)
MSIGVPSMFSRKKTEAEDRKMPDASDDLGIPMKPVRPPAPGAGAPLKAPAMPPRAPDLVRAADATRTPEMPRRPGEPVSQPRRNEAEVRKLIVGREITLSGEITSCDKLIVEGSVEANLANCRDVEIAESGLFKGSASIEDAEIHGRFEGNLVVRKRLLIKASGRVSGTIRYGQIEIECGGQISGDIQAQPSSEPGEITMDLATARAAS